MTSTIDRQGAADRVAAQPPTTIPPRFDSFVGAAPEPRTISSISARDVFTTVGAMVSACCFTLLLFGRLASFSGKTGFVFVFGLSFLFIYALLISLDDTRVAVVDKVMTALMTLAATVAIVALSSVVIFVFLKGREALFRLNFFTEDLSLAGPTTELEIGGISHAIVGTLIQIAIALVLTVPLAVACAVYLNESSSRLSEFVRSVVTAMTALPSIVAGLFVFAFWILVLGYPRSGFAASIAISLMMLPIIVRSADVVLRLVPGSLREAAAALGAPQWRVVWHVVLPTARSGLTTAILLGVARGIGETAPVLLVSGSGKNWNTNPFDNPMNSLPLTTFELVRTGIPQQEARGFATASVLMLLVLLVFSTARIMGGRPAGQLSNRQSRRAASRSVRDLERIESSDSPDAVTHSIPVNDNSKDTP